MSKKKKTYKVVCDDLSLVLFVKGFTLDEERKLYGSIRKKIETADTPISIESYQEFIVKTFLEDGENFLENLPEEADDHKEVLGSVYESIVQLYPPFSLEFVCQDLNTSIFFQGVEGRVLQHLKEKYVGGKNGFETVPITLSSIEDIKDAESFFKENIIGQRQAIKSVIKCLKLMASGLAKHSSFLFVGPTGVGKTELAKLVGEKFSGNFYKINCAEYASAHEYAKLIGAPPGYIGHTDKSLLAEKAEKSNRWVFLFDEIEKAHPRLYDFLLSLLDDGTCTDNLGAVLDFTETVFIFTSNQGISEINRDPVGFSSDTLSKTVTKEIIGKSIKKHFSPEFLNRIDETICFDSLTQKDVREIVALQLDELPIHQTDNLVNFVVEGGYSEEYGARNVARFIKQNVAIKIADSLLNKKVPKESEYYTPRISKGEVKIINTKKFESPSD